MRCELRETRGNFPHDVRVWQEGPVLLFAFVLVGWRRSTNGYSGKLPQKEATGEYLCSTYSGASASGRELGLLLTQRGTLLTF